MKNGKNEKLLNAAINNFQKNIGIKINTVLQAIKIDINGMHEIEILKMNIQGIEILYHIEIVSKITQTELNLLSLKSDEIPYDFLLITKYVSSSIGKLLKEKNIQFIDSVGNMFISHFPIHFFITGNKPEINTEKNKLSRIFKTTGLKIIFAFLVNHELINNTYREIAAEVNISLGEVAAIMKELKENHFLIEKGKKNRKIIQKDILFKRWCIEYPENLRPKLFFGIFSNGKNKKQNIKLINYYSKWGGEVAAEKLTDYITPEKFTIYIDEKHLEDFLIQNKLKRDRRGKIEIYKKFWNYEFQKKYKNIVHPILVYADLISSKDQRDQEVSKIIYEKYIAGSIR